MVNNLNTIFVIYTNNIESYTSYNVSGLAIEFNINSSNNNIFNIDISGYLNSYILHQLDVLNFYIFLCVSKIYHPILFLHVLLQ